MIAFTKQLEGVANELCKLEGQTESGFLLLTRIQRWYTPAAMAEVDVWLGHHPQRRQSVRTKS